MERDLDRDLDSDGDLLRLRAPGLEDLDRERYCRGGLGRSVTAGRMRSFDADRERDGATFGLGGGVFSLGGEGVGFLGGMTGGGVGDFLGGGEYLGSGLGSGLVSTGSGFFSGVGVGSGLSSGFFSMAFCDFFASFAGACFTDDFVRAFPFFPPPALELELELDRDLELLEE